jgi:anti-sigma regulatory factor (Ser/Thr protein kinase)
MPTAAAAGSTAAEPPRLVVPGQPQQVQNARAFVAQVFGVHALRADVACLLASELVTNSVQHSASRQHGGMITVTVAVMARRVLVKVIDEGGASEPVLENVPDDYAEGGRGLRLVAELSDGWGYYRDNDRLVTWFEIAAEPLSP